MVIKEILAKIGVPVKKQGRTLGTNWCPNCGESSAHSNKLCVWQGRDGKQRWTCHACHSGGDVADLLAAVHGVSLGEALRMARRLGAYVPESHQPLGGAPAPSAQRSSAAFAEVARRLQQALPTWDADVAAYLMARGIERHVIMEAAQRGIVRMLPADPQVARRLYIDAAGGVEPLKEAGLWAGSSTSWPANVFRPLLFFNSDCSTVEFRSIAPSQRPKAIRQGVLAKPFVWASPNKVAAVVCEGVIDMMSLVQMGERRTIMAVPGVTAWRLEWFVAAHKAYGTRFVVAFDDDEAGNAAAQRLIDALQRSGIEACRLVPQAKDWNAMLA